MYPVSVELENGLNGLNVQLTVPQVLQVASRSGPEPSSSVPHWKQLAHTLWKKLGCAPSALILAQLTHGRHLAGLHANHKMQYMPHVVLVSSLDSPTVWKRGTVYQFQSIQCFATTQDDPHL